MIMVYNHCQDEIPNSRSKDLYGRNFHQFVYGYIDRFEKRSQL